MIHAKRQYMLSNIKKVVPWVQFFSVFLSGMYEA